ncbi:unnamed protein product [Heligmosomoides polygyrus]|uniref:ZP domain-containing protein n=1 Tax=Heligmosomoides polygyrus TaxID=6339 RepID=A0A3P8CJZ6_HELPZ|nr:unnamed protein product [Heligmosomoides polygyrus]
MLSELIYDGNLMKAHATSQVFKYADSNQLYFTCQIRLCQRQMGMCQDVTPPLCGLNRQSNRTRRETNRWRDPEVDVATHEMLVLDAEERRLMTSSPLCVPKITLPLIPLVLLTVAAEKISPRSAQFATGLEGFDLEMKVWKVKTEELMEEQRRIAEKQQKGMLDMVLRHVRGADGLSTTGEVMSVPIAIAALSNPIDRGIAGNVKAVDMVANEGKKAIHCWNCEGNHYARACKAKLWFCKNSKQTGYKEKFCDVAQLRKDSELKRTGRRSRRGSDKSKAVKQSSRRHVRTVKISNAAARVNSTLVYVNGHPVEFLLDRGSDITCEFEIKGAVSEGYAYITPYNALVNLEWIQKNEEMPPHMKMIVAEVKLEGSANLGEELKKTYPKVCEEGLGDCIKEKAELQLVMVHVQCSEVTDQSHTLLLKLLIGNSTGLWEWV